MNLKELQDIDPSITQQDLDNYEFLKNLLKFSPTAFDPNSQLIRSGKKVRNAMRKLEDELLES